MKISNLFLQRKIYIKSHEILKDQKQVFKKKQKNRNLLSYRNINVPRKDFLYGLNMIMFINTNNH